MAKRRLGNNSGYETDPCESLKDSLARLRAETCSDEKGRVLWRKCVRTVRRELEPKANGIFYSRIFNGVLAVTLIIICVCVFFYFCKPASFVLKKSIHTKLYYISRSFRKALLVLDPYLQHLGINVFNSCMIKNPFISSGILCPTKQDIKEMLYKKDALADYIFEDARNAKWWTVRSAMKISNKVTLEQLHKYSVENNGHLPNMCEQVVGGGREGDGTVLYDDVFDMRRINIALKAEFPWSLSWVECPDEANNLTLLSIFPPTTYLPSGYFTSTRALISLSTEWCFSLHYQNGLLSTLLNLVVVTGEVVIIPVLMETEHCVIRTSRLWQDAVFLKEGDMVILDSRFWSYEVQTLSDYSITVALPIISSES